MEDKKRAIRKMEYQAATDAGVPTTSRGDFLAWYRKTLDYRLKRLAITVLRLFKR